MICWQRRDGTVIRLDGERMRELRASAGQSQSDVADAVGCTAAAVSTWETESRCPSLPQIARLFKVYGSALAESGALTVSRSA